MEKRLVSGLSLALTLLLASWSPGATRAHAEIVERVVAVVNDEAIWLSELRLKASPFIRRAMQAPTQAQRLEAVTQIYRDVLDRMIDERLILQVAAEEQVRVQQREVEEAIDNVRNQSGLSDADFWRAVRAQGFTEEQYRSDVRRQLMRLKVINLRVRGRVNITEEDVRRRYDESAVRARRESTFEANYIRLPLPEGANATQIHAAMDEAQRIRSSIVDDTDFALAMDEHGGGSTQRISEHDLAPELAEALLALDEHEISQPVRTENAIFIFQLEDRDQAASDLPNYEASRMTIYREMMQEAMSRQEGLFVDELRRRAQIDRRLSEE